MKVIFFLLFFTYAFADEDKGYLFTEKYYPKDDELRENNEQKERPVVKNEEAKENKKKQLLEPCKGTVLEAIKCNEQKQRELKSLSDKEKKSYQKALKEKKSKECQGTFSQVAKCIREKSNQ